MKSDEFDTGHTGLTFACYNADAHQTRWRKTKNKQVLFTHKYKTRKHQQYRMEEDINLKVNTR